MDEPDRSYQTAKAAALAYVAEAPRTCAEVRRKLQRSGHDAHTVESVVEHMKAVGLLDDRAFAEAWVESRSRARKLGRVRLEAELRTKGVEPEIVRDVLASLSPEDELANARTLARVYLGSADPCDRAVRQRLAGYLLRRGHLWDTIEQVLLELESKD